MTLAQAFSKLEQSGQVLSARRAQLALLGALTLAQLGFSLWVHWAKDVAAPSRYSLTHLHFDPYTVGLIVQETLIPVALVFLLSHLGAFQRLVGGLGRRRDGWTLFVLLTLVQVLFYAYGSTLNRLELYQVTRGYTLVMMAGLLGGPLLGLGLGAVTFVLVGLRAVLFWPPDTFELSSVLYWYFLTQSEANPLLWLGLASGVLALLLGKRRFFPGVALIVGIVLETVSRYFAAWTMSDPGYWIEPLVINTLTSGLALVVFALTVRNVQSTYLHRQTEAAELALAKAELRALRAQINPHFLFNSLNTIRYFVRTQPDRARDLLLDLSEVFERALQSGDFVPLRDEIRYAESYLALEQARLGERLKVVWTLPSEALLEMPVPTLVLQPLVENAVAHGLAPKPDGGTLSITLESWGADLVMQVRDDGVGFNPAGLRASLSGVAPKVPPPGNRPAIGLRNIQQRLRLLYGENAGLDLESEPGRGTRVQLRLPLATSTLALSAKADEALVGTTTDLSLTSTSRPKVELSRTSE